MDINQIIKIIELIKLSGVLVENIYEFVKKEEMDDDIKIIKNKVESALDTFGELYQLIDELKQKKNFTEDEKLSIDNRLKELKIKYESIGE